MRHPNLFDGIVAGPPIRERTRGHVATAWSLKVLREIAPKDTEGRPLLAKPYTDAVITAQCDALDGLAHRVINSAWLCDANIPDNICAEGISAIEAGNGIETVHDRYGAEAPDAFAHLYLLPGLGHGRTGIGPGTFPTLDALMAWVEEDKVPAMQICGGTPERKRPMCRYPTHVTWSAVSERWDRQYSRYCAARQAPPGTSEEIDRMPPIRDIPFFPDVGLLRARRNSRRDGRRETMRRNIGAAVRLGRVATNNSAGSCAPDQRGGRYFSFTSIFIMSPR